MHRRWCQRGRNAVASVLWALGAGTFIKLEGSYARGELLTSVACQAILLVRGCAAREGCLKNIHGRGFGLLIAYVIPGFLVLVAASFHLLWLQTWLLGATDAGPSIGGFLYFGIAAVGCGMACDVVRWFTLKVVETGLGLPGPSWNDATLSDRLAAFDRLVEDHFRYHQFYGNAAIAILVAYVSWRGTHEDAGVTAIDLLAPSLFLLFVAGARDALSRYYRRTAQVLGEQKGDSAMTNGSHPKKADAAKPQSGSAKPSPSKPATNTPPSADPKK